jgi:hypothetical protein
MEPGHPPRYGDEAANNFSNSLHVAVPSGGHGFSGLGNINCIDNLIAVFIERGSAKGPDTSCVKSIGRRGFRLTL